MLTEDYLVRMVRLAVAALAKAVGLRAATLYTDALFTIDQALQGVTGFNSDLLARMTDESLLSALSDATGPDPDRLVVTADLILEEAEVYHSIQQPHDASGRRMRALFLYLEAVFAGGPVHNAPPHDQIREILDSTPLDQVPGNLLYPLYLYFEQTGQVEPASRALESLLRETGQNSDLVAEARGFYTRLLQLPPQDLARHGLSAEDLRARLAKL